MVSAAAILLEYRSAAAVLLPDTSGGQRILTEAVTAESAVMSPPSFAVDFDRRTEILLDVLVKLSR